MSLTLLLIRHCKSDWTAGAVSDHDRPLNPRGQRDAPRIGAWLRSQGLTPDLVLCSDACRTRQTWDGITSVLPSPLPKLVLSRDFYLAEPAVMLRAIQQVEGAQTVAVVAHSPGIPSLAWDLVEMPPVEPEFGTYPTGAVTVIDFDAEAWADITRGDVRAFVIPRGLPDRD